MQMQKTSSCPKPIAQNATGGEKRTQVYETPAAPLLRIDTASQSKEASVKAILDKLQSLNRLKKNAD